MKKASILKKLASLLLIPALLLPGCTGRGNGSETTAASGDETTAGGDIGGGIGTVPAPDESAWPSERGDIPTLSVDLGARDHAILHGSAGFLYGISNEGVPDVNTLTPLKPKILATKGALGTEHPYGDALDVAEEFFLAGGEQVQMYCSNYYGVFGVTADAHDYGDVLKDIIAPAVAEWKAGMKERFPDIDDRIVYIPINEGTPQNGVSGFNAAWKIYYDSIKASDPEAKIAGPNDAVYRGSSGMVEFLKFCRDNDCLPDVMTWHELQVGCLDTMDEHIAEYRKLCEKLKIDEVQVVINEYADFADCGVPGRLVNWISRLEENEVCGCLPFWHQANNLNDLAANANQGNGAWWVYKWYGDMSGDVLSVSAKNTAFDGFYGMASADDNKRAVSVICGGVDGDAAVTLGGLDKSEVFRSADRVRVKVEASYFTGYHGASYGPDSVFEGVFPVRDGKVYIELDGIKFSTAYRITVTETSEPLQLPAGGFRREVYEAEDAVLLGELTLDYQNSPIESPSYFCSGGIRVGGIDKKGEGIEYNITVPADGLYRLEFLYGNGVGSTRNNQTTHAPKNISQKLVIDGGESELPLPSTLFYSMEGIAERCVSLKAGYHKISLIYSGDAGAFHDALYVTRVGAYGDADPNAAENYNRVFEAEAADFNELGGAKTSVRAESAVKGFGGDGYVTRLDGVSVSDGGGIRFIADVPESGLYHLIFRYTSKSGGKLRVYVDNTNMTFENLTAEAEIKVADVWENTHVTVFLRQGINIIDIDSTSDGGTGADVSLDSMRILGSGVTDLTQTFEAEDSDGKFETAKSGGTVYVKEMAANDGYLEFTVSVPEAGAYKLTVFQSNNDLCGTHSYNIKIIDRYASVTVNGRDAGRYFFPNSFSDGTFLERTLTVDLDAGENKVRIYNDDSWHVLWGGSTSEPGTNELKNFTPNFDRFNVTPATAELEVRNVPYNVSAVFTDGGIAFCGKADGGKVTVNIVPDGSIVSVTANGTDITSALVPSDGGVYTAEIEIASDTVISAVFAPPIEGEFDEPEVSSSGVVSYGGKNYRLTGENLFPNGDFEDNTGAGMDVWYVGKNTNGHPSSGDYMRPMINADGSLSNLTPLTESGLLVTGSYEPSVGANKFYFGEDNSLPEGMRHYLVESVGEPWMSNAWNGAHSLLAFVKIKPNTKYYFTFRAYTAGGAASVRYGAVNMADFVQPVYRTSDTLDFAGSGYMSCTNGDVQNVGGAWKRYESVIDSGDGDYFIFNAYWMQMCSYLCMGDFRLVEVGGDEVTGVVGAERLPSVTVSGGGELSLPEKVTVTLTDGTTTELPVSWLNGGAVDVTKPGVYKVTGYAVIPDSLYASGVVYVTQRVVVE